jgi:hypothetical protein
MDSEQSLQVGALLQYPPISPLSLWERTSEGLVIFSFQGRSQ